MRSVVDFYEELLDRYGGAIQFKRICEEEGIIILKAKLPDGMNGLSVANGKARVIVLNEGISFWERRDWAFHELWHVLKSPRRPGDRHQNKREEANANLFAALCRAPLVKEGDTIDSLMEKYNVCRSLAKLRIEFEMKRTSNN